MRQARFEKLAGLTGEYSETAGEVEKIASLEGRAALVAEMRILSYSALKATIGSTRVALRAGR